MPELIKYLLLGLIQGLTEPLPISSSAHMAIVSNLLNVKNNSIDFEIFVNFASTLAVFWFLKKNIYRDFFQKNNKFKFNFPLLLKIFLATIAVVITGYFFKDALSLQNNHLGIMLIVTSFLLVISSLLLNKTTKTTITKTDAIILGLFQSVSIIPGLSRSGTVLFGGISRKIKPTALLTFSFYMYLVVSVGALVIALPDLNIRALKIPNMIVAFLGAFIMTLISIKYLYRLINQKSLLYFGFYALIIGIILTKLG